MDHIRSTVSPLALRRAGVLGSVKLALAVATLVTAPTLLPVDAPGFDAMARTLAEPGDGADDEDDEGEDDFEDDVGGDEDGLEEDDVEDELGDEDGFEDENPGDEDEGADESEDDDLGDEDPADEDEGADESEDEDPGDEDLGDEDEGANEDEFGDEDDAGGEDEAGDVATDDEDDGEDDAGADGGAIDEDDEDDGDDASEGGEGESDNDEDGAGDDGAASDGDGDEGDRDADDRDADDRDANERDDDERDDDDARGFASAAGLDAQDFDFDLEGYPARSNEILAYDLSDDDLAIARDLGFELIERRPLAALGGSIDRLLVPSDYSLNGAFDALGDSLPAAPFDFNHIYLLPDESVHREGGAVTPIGRPYSGAGLRVGVIDTLVDTNHPSLRDQSVIVRDFAERGGRDLAHGTAVVSILVGSDVPAEYSGLLPGAEVFAANVFTVNRDGRPATDTLAMVEALDWLTSQRVGVISISVAGPDSAIFAEAVSRAQASGSIIVAAVGNDGPAAPPLFPATYDGVVGVTAIDLNRRVFRRAGRGAHVDFSAPGVRVRTANADGGYSVVSGTSFATPVIAALIALRVDPDEPAAANDVTLLNRSALDLGAPGKDDVFGYGLLMLGEDR